MSENTSTDTSIQGITALIKTMFPKVAVTSPESSLLECGVDSISIMRLVSRWRKNGIKITFAELITEPTLKSWSEKLSRRVQKKEDGIGKDGGHPEVRTAADDESEYELTDVQYAYWVGRDENQQLGGVSCHAYLEITGKNIDENRLDTAFSRLIEAHPMLRTIFTQNGRQRNVKENHNDPLKIHDFRNSDMVSARRQAEAIRERNSHRKLDISRGKVIGLELLQYPDGSSRIFFDVDLLVSDVQSLNILLHDLAALYSGKNIQALENWSFRQYLEQQKKRSETEFLEAEKYWKKRIESMPSGPQLPYTGNTGKTPHFTRYKTVIGTDIWNSIKKQSLAHGITPAMTLAAAYGMVISRWSSSARFLINVPLFNRDTENENIEHAVADFTNLLLLECDYSENLTFAEHAKRLQDRFHQDCAHTAYSAIRVLRELARNEYSNGLTAPVVFACNLGTELTDSEVTSSLGTLDYMISQTPQVCLDHQIYEMPEGLMVCFDAVDSMFPKGLVGTMFSAYTDLLAEIGSADDGFGRVYLNDIPKGQLDVRKRINSTGAPVSDTLLAERIFTNAETRPDSPALFYGDSTVTYGQMHASVMRVASLLIQHGVKPLDRIAVSVPRGPLQIISVLAVLAAGAVYVPVSVTQPVSRKTKIIARAGIKTVLTTMPFDSGDAAVSFVNPMDASACEPLASPVRVHPDSPAYIIFTSGSTGEPKGVEISHRGAMNTILDITRRAGISSSDCAMAISAMDFDLSVFDVFGILGAGGSLVVIDEDERRDASLWLHLVHQHRVTVWNSVPVLLDMLLVAAENDSRPLPIRAVMLSGDWIGLDLPQRLADCCSGSLPAFLAMGGATEGSIWSNLFTVTLPLDPELKSIPYGFPLANQRYRVVDSLGRDCPDFVPGELLIGGTGVALRYVNLPEVTAERFFTENGERWYRTGDQGRYLPDGCLEFLGRKDHQVKVRGHRIELGEIESALRSLPEIVRAVAVTVGNPPQLAVAAETEKQSSVTADEIREKLSSIVPEYMVPNHIEFYESLPVSANGKIDRKAIILDLTGLELREEYEAPETDNEKAVAKVWMEVLNLSRVSRNASFFEAGGDSLLATRVITELGRMGLSAESPLKALFASPKLKDFSRVLSGGRSSELFRVKEDPEHRHDPFPLTEVQQAYWMGQMQSLSLNSKTYYMVELTGSPLNRERLCHAFDLLKKRHEMLRAVITDDGMQTIRKQAAASDIPYFSVTDEQEACSSVSEWWDNLNKDSVCHPVAAAGFLYGTGMRLAIAFSYMNLDGYSVKLLLKDLAQAYNDPAGYENRPPLTLSFRDYVLSAVADESRIESARKYWDEKIAVMPNAPQLPLRCSPDTVEESHFIRLAHTVKNRDWHKLRAKASACGITPSAVLLHAYLATLSRYSGENDVTVNVTLFDRKRIHPEIMDITGDFTSLLPVSYTPDTSLTFADAARKTAENLAEGLDHRELSSIYIQRELSRKRGSGMASLPVIFTSTLGVSQNDEDASPADGFLQITEGGMSETPQVWLDHQLYEKQDGIYLTWDYVEGLFDPSTVREMFDCYLETVMNIADGEWNRPINPELSRKTADTRKRINSTGAPVSDTLLAERIFTNAETRPDSPALFYGDSTVTYGQMRASVMRVASLLIQHGVKPLDRIAVSVPRGPLQIISVLAVLAAGAVYVPVSVTQPVSRKTKILARAGIKTVLTTMPFDSGDAAVSFVNPMDASACEPLASPVRVHPDSPAYIIFTSGSTGEPKGVEISHRGAMNTILDITRRAGISSSDCAMAISAMDFDLSVFDVFGILGAGGSLVVIDEDERRDASLWLHLVHQHRVTVWNSVPVLLDMLLVAAENDSRPLPIRAVMLSGDWIGLDLPQRLADCCSGSLPAFLAMGGATEGSIWSNLFTVTLPLDPELKSIPYGFPLANQRYRVVDSLGRDCPDFVPGELLIGGTGVALGYVNLPEVTAERFFTENGERWYRTGDQGRYLPDGCLEFLGRKDHQVKVRGHRIELGEIESALRSLPEIVRAVAVTVGNPPQLAVAAETEKQSSVTADEIREKLSSIVPEYMVPNHIEFYESLPVSANGKIDRKAIILDLTGLELREEYEAPETDNEKAVAKVWMEVLNLSRVSRNASFFEAGGDSLLATRVITELGRMGLSAESPLKALFASPKLKDFSRVLSGGRSSELFRVKEDPEHRHDPFPLTEVQQAYWMGQAPGLPLNSKTYYLVEMEGSDISVERLNEAFRLVVGRHEMLRTEITADGQQVIREKALVTPVEVTRVADVKQAVSAVSAWWNELNDMNESFPYAARAFEYGKNSMRLAMAFSYMNLDGYSIKMILREIAEAYRNSEKYSSRPPLALSFRDYILSHGYSEEKLQEAHRYWDEKIDDLPPAPQLPTECSPDRIEKSHFVRIAGTLPHKELDSIKARAREFGLTPSAVFLHAYAEVLCRYSGTDGVTVNMTLFDRMNVHPEIYDVAGDFTSLVPVAYRPDTTGSFAASTGVLAENLAEALDHRELSSIYIQRELSKRKGLSMASLPVVFTSTLGIADDLLSQDTGAGFLTLAEGGLSETPQVWLDHQLYETADGLYLSWDYVSELYDGNLIREMFECYMELIHRLVTESWQLNIQAELPKETVRIRTVVNTTSAPLSSLLLAERIHMNGITMADSPALFYGDRIVTYGQMHASVMRVASLLIQHGVKPLDRIAVSVPRGPLQIISVLAVLAAGAVYVPVSVTQPVSRKTKILARAGIKTVLTTMPFDSGDAAVSFVNPMDASTCEPLASPVRVHPDSPAYIIFTSGSTGEPKGVEISHRGAMNTILDITRRAGISSSDCAMAISAMDFDLSVFDVFGILGAGGSLVVIDEDERRDASLWLHLVHQHRVTVWNSVPVLLDMLLVAAENDSRPLPIRAVMLSGDWIGLDLPQRLADCCSGSLPAFLAMGGATEGSIWSNLFTVTLPLDPELKSIPYGFPLANQRYRVVDSLGRDCPDFVPGELLIGGTGVALGYVNLPEVTAERFFTENGERWYRTGDQGRYLPDGCLEFLGRKDHQVKVRGHRIELGEIESALRSLPEIVRAVAVTVGNPPQLAVAAETEKQSSVTADEIREKLYSIVPEYMVPNHIEFYESLPVSANGKIDRKAIIGSFSNVNTSMKEEDRPRGELENRVANIWQRILKLEYISRNDDFFMSGGDSLTATRFVQTLQQENITSAPLPLRTLFSTPTIASICSYIEQNSLRDHGDAADNSYEEGTL